MIMIKIGAIKRNIENADPSWINRQINGLKRDGYAVCVIIKIQGNSVNMTLGTAGCGGIGGGECPPNAGEQRIFDLWNKHHLN